MGFRRLRPVSIGLLVAQRISPHGGDRGDDLMEDKKIAVVAIGGNSLIKDKKHQTIIDQYLAAQETTHHLWLWLDVTQGAVLAALHHKEK